MLPISMARSVAALGEFIFCQALNVFFIVKKATEA
jgi:hypothetical protein